MITNMEHSVRARLQNQARSSHRPFQEVLQYYGLERFLYRLSQTSHSGSFVLKGALMLRVWGAEESRPARDIDLLGYVDNEIGLIGDVVHPAAEEKPYPTLLEFPAPTLRMYPRETVIAEKFEAIVSLGTTNSRMKDFFDIWLLSRQLEFDGSVLADALDGTFENRGTEFEVEPVGLTSEFATSDVVRMPWAAFLRKSNLESAPETLEEIREPLREFLLPIAAALAGGRKFDNQWSPPGPWR